MLKNVNVRIRPVGCRRNSVSLLYPTSIFFIVRPAFNGCRKAVAGEWGYWSENYWVWRSMSSTRFWIGTYQMQLRNFSRELASSFQFVRGWLAL